MVKNFWSGPNEKINDVIFEADWYIFYCSDLNCAVNLLVFPADRYLFSRKLFVALPGWVLYFQEICSDILPNKSNVEFSMLVIDKRHDARSRRWDFKLQGSRISKSRLFRRLVKEVIEVFLNDYETDALNSNLTSFSNWAALVSTDNTAKRSLISVSFISY